MFRPRPQAASERTEELEHTSFAMERFPVDIRGNVTFGRLMSGLATVWASRSASMRTRAAS